MPCGENTPTRCKGPPMDKYDTLPPWFFESLTYFVKTKKWGFALNRAFGSGFRDGEMSCHRSRYF